MFLNKQLRNQAFVLTMALGSAVIFAAGCKNGRSYKTTASHLEYKIIDDESGTPAKQGDYGIIEHNPHLMQVHSATLLLQPEDAARRILAEDAPRMEYR